MNCDPNFLLDPFMPKPEFMLIGGAKCGSTSFSKYLSAHPQVKDCQVKEPNFWTWKRHSREQYQSLFVNPSPVISPNPDQKIGGEYSTSSLLHPIVPRRVCAALPKIKILVLLRNPIDRAYSHFKMMQHLRNEPVRSFDEIVLKEIEEIPDLLSAHQLGFSDPNFNTCLHRSRPDGSAISIAKHDQAWTPLALKSEQELFQFYFCSYVFRSIYHDQLWRWLQLLPREQIMIVQAEKFFSNRKKIMKKAVNFLGLQPYKFKACEIKHTWGGEVKNTKSPGSYAPMKDETRELLNDFFTPYNKKLFSLIGEDYNWD